MAKAQLHQLLAVESDLKNKGRKILGEAVTTFKKRDEHFDGLRRTYIKEREDSDDFPPETKEIVTTVGQKIKYAQKAIGAGLDAQLSKEQTNTVAEAVAELKVGETVFGTFSATALLALENQLAQVREMYDAIPTLDPSKAWHADSDAGKGYFITDPEIRYRTVKVPTPIVLIQPTPEHPGQAQMEFVDTQVGRLEQVYRSGKISPAQKSELLERVDRLIIAVKQARSRANKAEVVQVHVAKQLFDFIDGDVL